MNKDKKIPEGYSGILAVDSLIRSSASYVVCWCFAFLAIIFCRLYIYDDATIGLVYSFEGILLFYRLSGIIYKSKFSRQIIWCSQFSFFIYITHEFYEAMMKKIVMIILPQYGFVQILEFLILPIAVSAFCIVAGAAMKKYLNPLFYLVCGYRKK